MKGKYITVQVLIACRPKPLPKKDIYTQLRETLAERKRLIQEWERAISPAWDNYKLNNKQAA